MKYYVGIYEVADVYEYSNIFQLCIYQRENKTSVKILGLFINQHSIS